MTEYLQELQDVADALKRLPGLLTGILVLQILMLLAMGALIWLVVRLTSALGPHHNPPPAPTPAHLNPFPPYPQPAPPYGTQPPYQQGQLGQQGYRPQG